MLDHLCLDKLQNSKNLLAFSAGVDSTALFFILQNANIYFDIAIVNYQTRAQSQHEVDYALSLAHSYNKKCFVKTIKLAKTNFEHEARKKRYTWFEELIKLNGYQNLITAHQLNDVLEWFLMQLSKGAGLIELLNFKSFEQRNIYNLVRPLLRITKQELLGFLQQNKILYFEDQSNTNTNFKRNLFRLKFSDALLADFCQGILRSFDYLQQDQDLILKELVLKKYEKLTIITRSNWRTDLRLIDLDLKQRNVVLSAKTKTLLNSQKSIVVAHRFAICFTDNYIAIAPFTKVIMTKVFKDQCRIYNIPIKLRPYLFEAGIDIKLLKF